MRGIWKTAGAGGCLVPLLLIFLQCHLLAGQAPPWPCLQNHAECQALLDSANNATANADIETYCRETGAYIQCLTSDLADCDPQSLAIVHSSYLDNIQLSLTTVCGQGEQFQCLQNWTLCEELFTQQNHFLNLGDYVSYCRVGEEYLACMETDLQDCSNQTQALHRQNYVTGVAESMNVTCHHANPASLHGSSISYECTSGLGACLANISTASMSDVAYYCGEVRGALQCISALMETCNHSDVAGTLTSYQQLEQQLCVESGDVQCSARWSECVDPLLPVISGFDISNTSNSSLLCTALATALDCMENNTAGCMPQSLMASIATYRQMQEQFCGQGASYQQCYQSLQRCQMEASTLTSTKPHSMCSAARQSLQCLEAVLQQCPGFINLTRHSQAVDEVCTAARTQCAATYTCFQAMNDKIQTQNLSIACLGYGENLDCLEGALQSCGWHYNGSLSFSQLSLLFQQTCSALTPFNSCPSAATCVASITPMTSLEDNYRPASWCRLLNEAVNCSLGGADTCGTAPFHVSALQAVVSSLQPCSAVLPSEGWSPPEVTTQRTTTTSGQSGSTTTAYVTGSTVSSSSPTSPTATPSTAPSSTSTSSPPFSSTATTSAAAASSSATTRRAPYPRTTIAPNRKVDDDGEEEERRTSQPVSDDHDAAAGSSGSGWALPLALALALRQVWG